MQMVIYFEIFWLFAVITEIFIKWETVLLARILLKIAEFWIFSRENIIRVFFCFSSPHLEVRTPTHHTYLFLHTIDDSKITVTSML